MSFKDQMAADMAHMLDTDVFADAVTYNGTPITAVVIVKEEVKAEGKHNKVVDTAEAFVQTAEVAAPAYRDTLVADGRTWTVSKVLESDSVGHKLALESDRRHAV